MHADRQLIEVDGPPPAIDVRRFRRDVRRAAARYLGQKVTHQQCLAAVEGAARECGVMPPSKRRTRGDRVLDALAWGQGSLHLGELPGRLEPHVEAWERGALSEAEFAATARKLLAQLQRPAPASPRSRRS